MADEPDPVGDVVLSTPVHARTESLAIRPAELGALGRRAPRAGDVTADIARLEKDVAEGSSTDVAEPVIY
jgi:hypothetical protein